MADTAPDPRTLADVLRSMDGWAILMTKVMVHFAEKCEPKNG